MHEMSHDVGMTTVSDWAPITLDFPARLAVVRHKMHWNIKEAALACGVKPQSWREWELLERKPRDYESVCQLISQHARCDLVWLMTGVVRPGLPGGPGQPVEPSVDVSVDSDYSLSDVA